MCVAPTSNSRERTAAPWGGQGVDPGFSGPPGGMGASPHTAGAPQAAAPTAAPTAAPQFAVPGATAAPFAGAQPDPTIIQVQPEPKAVDPATATIGSVFANPIPALSTAPQVLMNAYNAGASSPY